MKISHRPPHWWARMLAGIIIIGFAWPAASTLAQANCVTALSDATKSYRAGRYDEAVRLLKTCLPNKSMPEAEKIGGYRLLALCYLAKDNQLEAETAARQLLALQPAYKESPPQDPQPFIDLVKKVRQQLQTELAQKTASEKQKERERQAELKRRQDLARQQERDRLAAEEQKKKTAQQQDEEKKKTLAQQQESQRQKEKERVEELERQKKLAEQDEKKKKEAEKQNGGGGFPWKWVAVGGAAVGAGIAGVAVISGGGSGNGKTGEFPLPVGRPK